MNEHARTMHGLFSPASFWVPEFFVPSGWTEHAPFAFWLVDVHRPRIFVELGTHYGYSYLAFDQAVKRLGTNTRCFAVDTWVGDKHAGFYGPEVFTQLREYHDGRYAEFSQLIRSTFDDAIGLFQDGVIDLLHIDGRHLYEDVRHDFEIWKPKLSERAIVLFHDITVHQDDFGVFRAWDELAAQYPNFAFLHGHGLGVLGVGGELPERMVALFGASNCPALAAEVREAYARLGSALTDRRRCLQLAWEHGHPEIEASQLETELARKIAECEHVEELKRANADLKQQLAEIKAAQTAAAREAARAEALLSGVLLSHSWRLTAPLRVAMERLRRLRTKVPSLKKTRKPRPAGVRDSRKEWDNEGQRRLREVLISNRRIVFPQFDTPVVSFVLVFFGKAHLSLLGLESILAHASLPYEVVIVDNHSTDETGQLLERLEGALIVRNGKNVGFGPACRQAVEQCKGEYLCFLNNDALLQPGTLDAAICDFTKDSSIGAVGGKILLADGRLQEAGSTVWADGSAYGYGRGDDADLPQYQFRRPVDYCSAAFLVTPRKLFARLGGFDSQFFPAYYEDTDYCMRVWAEGLRVIYEPRAIIRHYEYASSEKHEAPPVLFRDNRKKFVDKWRCVLPKHLPPSKTMVTAARFAAQSSGLRILYLDDSVPHRDMGAGFPRANSIVSELARQGHKVTCSALIFPLGKDDYRDVPREVELFEAVRDADLERLLGDYLPCADLMFVSRPHNMARVLAKIRLSQKGNCKFIYDAEAVFCERDRIRGEITGKPISQAIYDLSLKREVALARIADAVTVVSQRDHDIMAASGLAGTYILSHALEADPGSRHFRQRKYFLFVGAMHGRDNPNADSMRYFSKEVWPYISRATGSELIIAGYGTHEALADLAVDGVRVVGPQKELTPLYEGARVVVVPTRFAAGIPFKAHEAAAHGVPMVVSRLIGEQLGWTDKQECLIADSPSGITHACLELYNNERLWEELRTKALSRISSELNPARFAKSIRELINTLVGGSMARCSSMGEHLVADVKS